MNSKAKGSRCERRCMRILERAGYATSRSSASLGVFDVFAVSAQCVRLVQVKSGTQYLRSHEREAIQLFQTPANVTKECWRFPDRCKQPLIEVIP
jgi:Holliday junction resolvase